LSQYAVLQSIELATKQINNELSGQQKFEFIKSQLQQVDGLWNDISLGCRELFGIDQTVRNSEWWKPELNHYQPYHPDVKLLIDSGKTFFATAHHSRGLEWLLKLWPNARIINCIDGAEFFNTLRKNHPAKPEFMNIQRRREYWTSIKKSHWPDEPPEWQHCFYLPPFDELHKDITQQQQQELFQHLPNKEYFTMWNELNNNHIKEIFDNAKQAMTWNTDFYLNKKQFIEKLHQLYQQLELEDFNKDRCSELLDCYIDALTRVDDFLQVLP
jgi:hypothetical protein